MDNSMEGSDLLYAEDLDAGDRFLSPLNGRNFDRPHLLRSRHSVRQQSLPTQART